MSLIVYFVGKDVAEILGYNGIKQEVLDSGQVVYHRKITQLGREFILHLFEPVN